MNVLGYLDRWSVQRGESLELKVSTTAPEFQVDVIRFDHYFSDPDPERDAVVAGLGTYPGRIQNIPIGSYAAVPSLSNVTLDAGFTFQCWLQPFLIGRGTQTVVSWRNAEPQQGFELFILSDGLLLASFHNGRGAGMYIESEEVLIANRWYFAAVRFDPRTKSITLDVNSCSRRWLSRTASRSEMEYGWYESEMPDFSEDLPADEVREFIKRGDGRAKPLADVPATDQRWLPRGEFLFGAGGLERDDAGRAFPWTCLNGKIDRPACWSRALSDEEMARIESGDAQPAEVDGCIAAWDFAQDVSTNRLVDVSGNDHHGIAVNMPMRAVVGANWDGTATSIGQNPAHYGAIAFHEDDLEDCGWETDLVIETDSAWQTGIYAARLQAGGEFDYVPFYVRPQSHEPKASVLFLAPTNTYLAYGNEKLINATWDDPAFVEKSTDSEVVVRPMDQYLIDHPELGASIYDHHPDGSGICYSSRLRPLLTMRPQYLMWLNGQARHFSGDLYLIEWLESQGVAYDVATDEDLHVLGSELLDGYAVVLTGGHPEYWTFPMLETLEDYLAQGGKLMYLGGNGFYWVTGMDADRPHLLEVRRGVSGIRAWTSHPGEVTLSITGEQGGLWRHRGKTPNSLCGIGFASEGWGGAPGYVQTDGRNDPRAAFIVDGIEPDEIIGDFGFVMGGAAGDEIDRIDYSLGSPDETIRIATTELRHSDYYQLVVEDVSFILPGLGGTQEPKVRSDIAYLEDENGGAVFSTGSINWIGSLMWNDGENNVSRMTSNVLRRFAGLA